MRFIITGALGHIGSQLIRSLPETFSGAEIILIDNLMTQRYCSMFNLPSGGNYKFIEADILDYNFKDLLQAGDIVIHLAAITDTALSFEKVKEVEAVNFKGTQLVAEACALKKARLIFLSSTSVYTPLVKLVDENSTKENLDPKSPYALSKLNSETFLKTLPDLEYVVLRFGTIFGFSIGMRFHTAVNKFCYQAIMKKPLSVWTTALHQRRPYLDLIDAVNALKFIAEKQLFNRDIFNVVTVNCTVEDIVNNIKVSIPDLKIELVEAKAMNDLTFDVSTKKLTDLGFTYKGNLQNSISHTVNQIKGINL